MAEQGWFDAGEIKPRDLAPNPRCQDCETGGMKHPAHHGRRCGVGFGEGCDCDEFPTKERAAPLSRPR